MKRSIIAKNITTDEVFVFESAMEASRQYGFDESHIIKCCRGRRKKHKGYTWNYYLPVKSLKDAVRERPWTFAEDTIIKRYFSSGDLSKLLDLLPGRNFKDLLCRVQVLKLERNTPRIKNITPYDLIYELAEDIISEEH